MFDRLVDNGPLPNAFIATTAISIAGRNNQARAGTGPGALLSVSSYRRMHACLPSHFSAPPTSSSQLPRAEEIFKWLQRRDPPSPPTHKTYTALIQAYSRAGQWRCARLRPQASCACCGPDPAATRVRSRAHARCARLRRRCLETFADMESSGIRPNKHTLSALLARARPRDAHRSQLCRAHAPCDSAQLHTWLHAHSGETDSVLSVLLLSLAQAACSKGGTAGATAVADVFDRIVDHLDYDEIDLQVRTLPAGRSTALCSCRALPHKPVCVAPATASSAHAQPASPRC